MCEVEHPNLSTLFTEYIIIYTYLYFLLKATQAKITFAYRDYLLRQTKHKSNEKKRQGAVKTYSDIFGMEGSFRQLEFD